MKVELTRILLLSLTWDSYFFCLSNGLNHHSNNSHNSNKRRLSSSSSKESTTTAFTNRDDNHHHDNDNDNDSKTIENSDNDETTITSKTHNKLKRKRKRFIRPIINNINNTKMRKRMKQKIKVRNFSQLEFLVDDGNDVQVDDSDNYGKWISSLLADIRDKYKIPVNPEEVTEKVGYHNFKVRGGGGRSGPFGSNKTTMDKGRRSYMKIDMPKNKHYDVTRNLELEQMDIFDSIGQSFSLITAGLVLIQSITSLLIHDDYALLDEVCVFVCLNKMLILEMND